MIRVEKVHTLVDNLRGGWALEKIDLLRLVNDTPSLAAMTYEQVRDLVEEQCHLLPGSYTLAYLNGQRADAAAVGDTAAIERLDAEIAATQGTIDKLLSLV
jgi:hypothetical protein